MSFTVVWMPDALTQLAELWTNAPDQGAVTAASHRIDQRLAVNPRDEGESRGGIERISFDRPLQVLFRVFEADRRVEVHMVGLFGPRP